MVGAPAKKESAFAKAASLPVRRQSENAGPRLFGFIFRRCPPSRRCFFFQFFELSTKAAFAKAAFDTLHKFVAISCKSAMIVIFFSLTGAPLPDLTPAPPNGPETDPKRSRMEPNGAETEPNGAEMDRNQAFRGGTGGGLVGVGGVGGCKGKRKSLRRLRNDVENNDHLRLEGRGLAAAHAKATAQELYMERQQQQQQKEQRQQQSRQQEETED